MHILHPFDGKSDYWAPAKKPQSEATKRDLRNGGQMLRILKTSHARLST